MLTKLPTDLPSNAHSVHGEGSFQDQYDKQHDSVIDLTDLFCFVSFLPASRRASTLPNSHRRSLCRPPNRRRNREDRMSVYSQTYPRSTTAAVLVPWVAPIRLPLAVQRSRATVREDQELELMHPRGGAEKGRLHAHIRI